MTEGDWDMAKGGAEQAEQTKLEAEDEDGGGMVDPQTQNKERAEMWGTSKTYALLTAPQRRLNDLAVSAPLSLG